MWLNEVKIKLHVISFLHVHTFYVLVCLSNKYGKTFRRGCKCPCCVRNLNTWACSASGWSSTWHLHVLHYSSEILNESHSSSASIVGQCVCVHTCFCVRRWAVCLRQCTVVCACMSWLVQPPLCVFIWEEIIKFAGKKWWQTAWVKQHLQIILSICFTLLGVSTRWRLLPQEISDVR